MEVKGRLRRKEFSMYMEQKFSLDLTPEEGILLLTGARLLDKLVAGISIHAKDRDELIRDIIEKITDQSRRRWLVCPMRLPRRSLSPSWELRITMMMSWRE